MKAMFSLLIFLATVGCQNGDHGKWAPIETSVIPSPRVEVWHDHQGWTLGMNRYSDVGELMSAISKSEEVPVMITLGKNSSIKGDELLALGAKLSAGGDRRVFHHQARGNIDSIESSFEFTR